MKKESCAISHEHAVKGFIINCAGEKVSVAGAGFTARCAVGNTDDYLKSFKDYINSEIVSWGEPASISVVIPSYASAEDGLSQILTSLCSQEYPAAVEILVFINEPENAPESVRIMNERNEKFIRSLENPAANSMSFEFMKTRKRLLSALSESKGNIKLRCVRQVLSTGLAGVYQAVTVSMIARLRAFADSVTTECDRPQKVRCIEKYLKHSMLLLCDDDMEIKDTRVIAKAYEHVVNHDAVVLGRLHIQQVDTVKQYSRVLRDLMQLFFDFKYDHGLNFLTPRGMLLADILKVGGVKVGQPFADQLFFAAAARGKTQYLLDATTSIGESNHPGNGSFLKELRLFLEGKDNDALDIFENVLKRYQEDGHQGKYCAADIERLILSLKTRHVSAISSVASELLARA